MKQMRLTMKSWMFGLVAMALSAATTAAPANHATTAPTGYWLQVESVMEHIGGPLDGHTTYRIYLNMLEETDYLSSCSGDSDNPLILSSSTGTWYNSPVNSSWSAQGINPVFFEFFPELVFDSYLTIGAEDVSTPASQQPSAVIGDIDIFQSFIGDPGTNVLLDDAVGSAWYTPFPGIEAAESHVGFAGEDLRVLVAQITTQGILSGQIQIQVFREGDQGNEFRDVLPLCSGGECGGCTDEYAFNYDPEALYDDGSCESNPDGCTDMLACNYSANAVNDDGSCQYLDACGVCGGTGVDTDGDGVCDDQEVFGCTDDAACNFNAEATQDDGLCAYPDAFEDCDGGCLNDVNENGICDEAEVLGCTDDLACNYNPEANMEDGTCEFESCQWCDDPEACNYEGDGLPWTANTELCDFISDGECDCEGNVLDAAGVCGGDCTADEDGDGVCDDVDTCIGVLDACGVCNGPGAVYACGCDEVPDGYCDCDGNQVDAVGVCGGNCALDADGDGWCDECINSPVEGYTLQTEVVVEHLEGSLMGMTTYRVYMACANALDYVNTCSGDNTNPLVLNSASGSWFNHPANVSFSAAGMNPDLFEMFPNLEFDSYLTIGSETTDEEHPTAIWGDISASDEFDGDASGFNVTVDDNVGGAWFLPFPGLEAADSHPGFAGEDQRVLLMQMTTAGPISGQIQVQIFQNGDQGQEIREVFLFDSEAVFDDCDNLDPCDGLIDECGVCNGPGAIFDCGCTVLPVGDCDCDGNQLDAVGTCGGDCVEDTNGDGVCDVVAEGCTDETACNYVVAVIDDGSCVYAEAFYDCNGTCVNDTDGDGVCDELEIPGCTDDTACNYSANATDDDGSCETLDECGECGGTGTLGCMDDTACNYDADADCDDASCTYPETYYACDGACLNDADADGICDELETPGCTDDTACNYNADATDADGSCEYAEEYFDCDGNCLNDADADGICDELEVDGCTDATACNYNADATDDDGSCVYAEAYYGCDGNCLNDADADGICDELETPGCTDVTACNYNADATDDDGSCEYAEAYYDCDGNCLNDADEDGICDELEVEGCTDATACNYNADATDDDGSCEYAEAYYDCDGNCLNDADEDGICDELEVEGCTDETACTYDELATDDDGTCVYPGDPCDDGDDTTINDVYTADCDCVGEVDGLDEATAMSWTLYPSPVRDVLNLRLEGGAWSGAIDGDVEVMVLGATGQVLRSERLAGRTQLDVSDLASGVYFLTLRSPAMATTTRRFVVAGGE